MSAGGVPGFRLGGVACGLKATGDPDLGLIAADGPCPAAAVATKNLVRAAPVELAVSRLRRRRAAAVLVNSGNANAGTGRAGMEAARRTTAAVARALGVSPSAVVPASTGVIGRLQPAQTVERAVPRLVQSLREDGVADFARAILTTDRGPKVARAEIALGRGRRARVLAVAKGAGMIAPDMATTLAFVLTDAPVRPTWLRKALRHAADLTFNRMAVDGDTSTNDMILALASGRAGGDAVAEGAPARRLRDALTEVLEAVGKMVVADGEGAEHLVRFEVTGAPNDAAALRVARTVATSLLVKTALHGCDPNWGRILAAAGRAGVRFDPGRADVLVGDVPVFRRGSPVGPAADAPASRVMRGTEYRVQVRLGAGRGQAWFWGCDLGHEYVRINADYHT